MPAARIPEDDVSRLKTLHEYSILDSLPEQSYEDVTALASFICGTPVALISIVDAERQWFKSRIGFDPEQTDRSQSFCAYTLNTRETLIVEDATLDPRFSDNSLVLGDPYIRFYAGAPIVAPNGHVLGTLCVIDTKPRVISSSQIAALESLSRQVMSLFELRLKARVSEKAAAVLMQSEKLAAVGRMASSMAHEINNPLEAVTNILYLLRFKIDDPEAREWLNQADQELRRVATIANRTLRFHKQSSRPQAVTCEALFSTTLSLYESRLRNSGIMVETRMRANDPLECFEGDIRQVLSNIITNAIDAMPKGGRLLVRSRRGRNWKTGSKGLILSIADTGTGMDSAVQSRLFEAFFSTRGIGGSGLGLWISAEIMHRHHGAIFFRSSQRPDFTGTVMALFLPYRPLSQSLC